MSKANSFQADQHVEWNWGNGKGSGQIKERFEREVRTTANPGSVVATDIGFSRAAREDGQWTAFRDYAAAIAPTGVPMRLALNVTFFDLMNPEFAFEVQSAVADTGFDWNLLTIEVTEQTMLGEQSGQIFRSLHELRARGASVALDRLAPYITQGDREGLPFFVSNAQKDIDYYRAMSTASGAQQTVADNVSAALARTVEAGHGQAYVPELVKLFRKSAQG